MSGRRTRAGGAKLSGLVSQLGAFVAVAETGAFRRAAERLGRSQPAVTAQVRELERLLGSPLFNRTTRRTSLTPAGAELLDRARRLVGEAERLVDDFTTMAAEGHGRVLLSVSPTIGAQFVATAAAAFEREHPHTALSVREDMSEAMFEALSAGRVEIGVGPYTKTPDALRFDPLFRQPFFLIRPRDGSQRGEPVSVASLADERLILPPKSAGARALIDAAAERAGIRLRPHHEALQFVTLVDMVASGLGVTVMPCASSRMLDAFDLAALPFRDAAIERPVGMIVRRGEVLTPSAAAFAGFLRASAKRLVGDGLESIRPAGAAS